MEYYRILLQGEYSQCQNVVECREIPREEYVRGTTVMTGYRHFQMNDVLNHV